MSKQLSFRARALDTTKCMPVYKADEVPELPDFAAINRAVPQMPTGMEKEEETEHHLQRALSAQQVYGTAERLVIPIPEIETVDQRYGQLYRPEIDYKPPKQFIHVQPWGMDQEIPDYDMDSEDETWLTKQSKSLRNLNLTPLKFENMMDRLEKGSGQTVVTLHEAKALLKEDDDLTIAVYDYWLNKRLRLEHALIPQVKTEKRDGSTTNNPYVAFRRRTEKMQTRKNRKNDETSYERMLKLRRDLNKALTILELMKRREKSKKELLKLSIEIMEKRYQMADWDGKSLSEALAQRHKLPSLIPLQNQYLNRDWGHKDDGTYVKKKRQYNRQRKHKTTAPVTQTIPVARPQLPHYSEDVLPTEAAYSSEEDGLSPPMSASDLEVEDDPDGIYAFRRKAGCSYHAPIYDGLGNWQWAGPEDGGLGDKRYCYSLASISMPRRCVGFARRRVGRGGRVILDRAFTEWDDYLSELDLSPSPSEVHTGWVADYTNHIKDKKIPHFRPQSPVDDAPSFGGWGMFGSNQLNPAFRDTLSPSTSMEFNVESFQDHREQLLQMQRQQQEQLLKQETDLDNTNSYILDHSFSSLPTSRFTLDSASAQFAASAVCNTPELPKPKLTLPATLSLPPPTVSLPLHSPALTALMQQPTPQHLSSPGATSTSPSSTIASSPVIVSLTNGPVSSKTCGLSTSPAANILQLNYPITPTPSPTITPVSHSSAASSFTKSSAIFTTTSTPLSTSIALAPTTLLSTLKTTSLQSTKSLGTLSLSIPRITPAKHVLAPTSLPAKTVTQSAPTVLKLASTPTVRNDSIPRENHDSVNNIAQDKIVAMEVT